MSEVVIVSAARTPVGSFNGAFANTPAHELGKVAIAAALERAKIDPGEVDEVIFGQVLTANTAQNPARQAAIAAGIPAEKTAWALNQLCGSDRFAVAWQNKAEAAQKAGKFKDEIAPVTLKTRKGDVVVDADEYIRAGTTLDSVAKLKPAFSKEGTVTAGNASGINDGAAALVLMRASDAQKRGLTPLARIASWATAGVDPAIMGTGPIPSSRRALEKAGWKVSDLDLVEANEAFAAQAC